MDRALARPDFHARIWARIALLAFGGPAGQIGVMHRILVDEERMLSEEDFLHGLGFVTLLPGPEAQQFATWAGWRMYGLAGGVLAGGLFILPGFVAMLALTFLHVLGAGSPAIAALFFGLTAAVLAILLHALWRLQRRALRSWRDRALALAAFVALWLFATPFPLVIGVAALVGALAARRGAAPAEPGPALRPAPRAAAITALLWLAPVAALALFAPQSVFADIAAFFSRVAAFSFGGAYAVLAWVTEVAVGQRAWLTPAEMRDGVALAETTPGPLILALQFVGFLAAMRAPGPFDPLVAGTLGAMLAVWVLFLPSFLWIFLGAPHAERLRANRRLAGALAGVSVAVVGVIANFALWFASHSLFALHRPVAGLAAELPVPGSLDPVALGLALGALLALAAFRVPVGRLLAGCALAGLVLGLAGLA